MGWNSETNSYACNRCRIPVSKSQTLCSSCRGWLEKYMDRERKRSGKESQNV